MIKNEEMPLLQKFGIALEKNLDKLLKYIKAEKPLLNKFLNFARTFEISSEIPDKEMERLKKQE